jgi:hypothetical protein
MHRLFRTVLVLLTFGILCSGPVVACVCADSGTPRMPCCPHQPVPDGHAMPALPVNVNMCAPVLVDAPQATSLEVPMPLAVADTFTAAWPPPKRPPTVDPPDPDPLIGPPIYLITLRLRN